jgi:hypothetical protein
MARNSIEIDRLLPQLDLVFELLNQNDVAKATRDERVAGALGIAHTVGTQRGKLNPMAVNIAVRIITKLPIRRPAASMDILVKHMPWISEFEGEDAQLCSEALFAALAQAIKLNDLDSYRTAQDLWQSTETVIVGA